MPHQLGGRYHVDRIGRQVAAGSAEAGAEGVAQHVRPERLPAVGLPDARCCPERAHHRV
ncbi:MULTISPECIES: hypothetical protein [Nocardiopsis]|uniref:hypothetical protein n=1 Tax=Nocardiopsis TaxID=2013 RepID=UPI001479433A|nr:MULTISPECIES: hypothetical protein [Nocardiopsis]